VKQEKKNAKRPIKALPRKRGQALVKLQGSPSLQVKEGKTKLTREKERDNLPLGRIKTKRKHLPTKPSSSPMILTATDREVLKEGVRSEYGEPERRVEIFYFRGRSTPISAPPKQS